MEQITDSVMDNPKTFHASAEVTTIVLTSIGEPSPTSRKDPHTATRFITVTRSSNSTLTSTAAAQPPLTMPPTAIASNAPTPHVLVVVGTVYVSILVLLASTAVLLWTGLKMKMVFERRTQDKVKKRDEVDTGIAQGAEAEIVEMGRLGREAEGQADRSQGKVIVEVEMQPLERPSKFDQVQNSCQSSSSLQSVHQQYSRPFRASTKSPCSGSEHCLHAAALRVNAARTIVGSGVDIVAWWQSVYTIW